MTGPGVRSVHGSWRVTAARRGTDFLPAGAWRASRWLAYVPRSGIVRPGGPRASSWHREQTPANALACLLVAAGRVASVVTPESPVRLARGWRACDSQRTARLTAQLGRGA